MAESKKQVAEVKNQLPANLDYGEYGDQGFEDQTSDDLAIPFLNVLQANSPQCEGEDAEARPGMFFNTVTGEHLSGKEGVYIVPSKTDHNFVEWVPREDGGGGGGGFVGIHQLDSDIVAGAKESAEEYGKYKTKEGNDLVETFYIYGVLCSEDGEPLSPIILAFTSTKIKRYKAWSTSMNLFRPKDGKGNAVKVPMFAHYVKMTTFSDKNSYGSFYNVTLEAANGSIAESLLAPTDERFVQAKGFYDVIKSGAFRADFDGQRKTEGKGDGDFAGAGSPPPADGSTPF